MEYLTGKDYPWFCSKCRATVDSMVELVEMGPDTDDNEAPLMRIGDLGLFCGGRECWDTEFDGYGFREIRAIVDVMKADGEIAAVKFARERDPDAKFLVTEEFVAELAAEVAHREGRERRAILMMAA